MRTGKFLDEVMREKGFRRDKELAEWLNVTGAAIAQYRSGARTMDNEKCVKIALELGIDPIKIIMASDLDRAERAGQKSLWEVFMTRTQTAKSAGVAAALLLVFVTLFLTPDAANAATTRVSESISFTTYKLCEIKVVSKLLHYPPVFVQRYYTTDPQISFLIFDLLLFWRNIFFASLSIFCAPSFPAGMKHRLSISP